MDKYPCFCKETKKNSNFAMVEQLSLFPSNDCEIVEPRKKGERISHRCPKTGKFVNRKVIKMFPCTYREELYKHDVKRIKIGGSELPNAA